MCPNKHQTHRPSHKEEIYKGVLAVPVSILQVSVWCQELVRQLMCLTQARKPQEKGNDKHGDTQLCVSPAVSISTKGADCPLRHSGGHI